MVTSRQPLEEEDNIKPHLLSFQEISSTQILVPGWKLADTQSSNQDAQMLPMNETSKDLFLCNGARYNPGKHALIRAECTSLFIIDEYIIVSS